jgi:hypothetical protein
MLGTVFARPPWIGIGGMDACFFFADSSTGLEWLVGPGAPRD